MKSYELTKYTNECAANFFMSLKGVNKIVN